MAETALPCGPVRRAVALPTAPRADIGGMGKLAAPRLDAGKVVRSGWLGAVGEIAGRRSGRPGAVPTAPKRGATYGFRDRFSPLSEPQKNPIC